MGWPFKILSEERPGCVWAMLVSRRLNKAFVSILAAQGLRLGIPPNRSLEKVTSAHRLLESHDTDGGAIVASSIEIS